MAEVMGTEGIYKRDIMRNFVKRRAEKDGIPGICEAGDCTDAQINEFITGRFGEKKTDKKEKTDTVDYLI